VLPIHIPPLRDRPADIADLAVQRAVEPEAMGLSEATFARLQAHA